MNGTLYARRNVESLDKKEADRCLNKIIDTSLVGSTDYIKRGTSVALELLNLLIVYAAQYGGLSISRAPDLAGSIGKQSHLGPSYRPDLDMVLYINVPPALVEKYGKLADIPNDELEKVIADNIKTITQVVKLLALNNRDLVFKDSWEVCVDVKYKGFDFDLVPAINFQEGDAEATNAQWTAVLNRCAKKGKDIEFLGPSMSDKVVDYVHGRDCVTEGENMFCRRVVKLAKMWKTNVKALSKKFNHGLKRVEKMCAESTIIELVALHAAQLEFKHGVGSVTKAFATFIEIMATDREEFKVILDTRGVAFPCDVDKQLKANEEAKGGGMLIDPVNPYLNYLHPSKYDVIDGMKELQWAAKKSLSILRYGCYCGCGKLERRMRHAVGIVHQGEQWGAHE